VLVIAYNNTTTSDTTLQLSCSINPAALETQKLRPVTLHAV